MGQRLCRGQKQSRKVPGTAAVALPVLQAPADEAVVSICALDARLFAACGVDGWVHLYDWTDPSFAGSFRAHRKSVNQAVPLGGGRLLTASNDATVRLWSRSGDVGYGLPADAGSGGTSTPSQTFEGHNLSVSALDILDAVLVTGSRDCTLRCWDLETGQEVQRRKDLRNVVTALRRVPDSSQTVVQASEDLQLRLWDFASGPPKPAHSVRAGPNQLVCLDVSDDGLYVACGSKGFSRDNCEVKVFDIRGGLRELSTAACAEQTIEALCVVGARQCLAASKDGSIHALTLPEACVVSEHVHQGSGYSALAACRRLDGRGPVALAALVGGGDGAQLELLSWPDAGLTDGTPELLAMTAPGHCT